MTLYEEANALREQIDELARGSTSVEQWRIAEAAMTRVMREGRRHIEDLESEIETLCDSAQSCWRWVSASAELRELREALDDLLVLRMCMQSRIFELEASAVLAAL